MTPTDTLLASLDPDPVLRGRQFERFVVTLLRTHPLWALEGWFAHAMARHGRPAGRHRRAPPEAVLIGKRRDPPVPVTGITGNGQHARQPETEPPGHHVDEPGGQSVDAGVRRPARSRRAGWWER